MPDVVVLQRVVPHYRLPLWRGLHEQHGWHVVCAANPPGDTHLHLENSDAPFIHRYPFGSVSLLGRSIVVPPLGRILKDLRPRVIVAEFSLAMLSTWELALRRLILGQPRVAFHTHGFNMERGFRTWTDRLMQLIRIPLYRASDHVLCYSDEGRDFVIKYLPAGKVTTVENTIDTTNMRALRGQQPREEPRGSPRLLSIGRLTADKDFPRLVRVFRSLVKDLPDAKLVIIGEGPERARIEQAASDLLNTRIFLPGAIYDDETNAAYFNWADLVVFAGAVGLSVNHALAYGVPVIAYARMEDGPAHHPEIAYVVDGVTGVVVKKYTELALREALIHAVVGGMSPRERYGPNINDFVAQNLNMSNVICNFHRAFSAIL